MLRLTHKIKLILTLNVLFSICTNVKCVQRYDDQISHGIAEKGKKQLNELEQKSHLPRYGDCWLQALTHLHDGCRMLTDSIQVDLALHFTNCFMEMSGQDRLDCVSERTEALKRLCMSEMSDRAFAVYTEFFTQTQNMCFFLHSQKWQEESDRTIERLSVKSREVSERLEEAGEVQRVVLEHQLEGVKLQGKMLELGGSLAKTLNGSQETLDRLTDDLEKSTKEHQAILSELFREFYLLHSWIVGRYAFVDRVLFYMSLLLIIMVGTSTKRTNDSRPNLILGLIGSLILEVTISKLLAGLDTIQKDQIHWIIRKLSIVSSLLIFFYHSYHYQDLNKKLLNEIKEQNRQIIDSILRMKLEASANPTAQNLGNEEKDSCSTFSFVATQTESGRSAINFAFERALRKLPLVPETESADYEKENSLNERRSVSESLKTPDRKITRGSSQTSESSVSRASRYNLRRKTMNYN